MHNILAVCRKTLMHNNLRAIIRTGEEAIHLVENMAFLQLVRFMVELSLSSLLNSRIAKEPINLVLLLKRLAIMIVISLLIDTI